VRTLNSGIIENSANTANYVAPNLVAPNLTASPHASTEADQSLAHQTLTSISPAQGNRSNALGHDDPRQPRDQKPAPQYPPLIEQGQGKHLPVVIKRGILNLKQQISSEAQPKAVHQLMQLIAKLSHSFPNYWEKQMELYVQLHEPVLYLTYTTLAAHDLKKLKEFNQCAEALGKNMEIITHKFEKRLPEPLSHSGQYQALKTLNHLTRDIKKRLPIYEVMLKQTGNQAQIQFHQSIFQLQRNLALFSFYLNTHPLQEPNDIIKATHHQGFLNDSHARLWHYSRLGQSQETLTLLKSLGDELERNNQRIINQRNKSIYFLIKEDFESLKTLMVDGNRTPRDFIALALRTLDKISFLEQAEQRYQQSSSLAKIKHAIPNMLKFMIPIAEQGLIDEVYDTLEETEISLENRTYFINAIYDFNHLRQNLFNQESITAYAQRLLAVLENLPIVLTGLIEQSQTISNSDHLTDQQKFDMELWLTRLFYNEKTFVTARQEDLIHFNESTKAFLTSLDQDAQLTQRVASQLSDASQVAACTDWAASTYIDILAIHESYHLEQQLQQTLQANPKASRFNLAIDFVKNHQEALGRLIRFAAFKQFLIVNESFDHTAHENIEHALYLYRALQKTFSLPGGPVAQNRMAYGTYTENTFKDTLGTSMIEATKSLTPETLTPHQLTHLESLEGLGILIWRSLKRLCPMSPEEIIQKENTKTQIKKTESRIQALAEDHLKLKPKSKDYQAKEKQLTQQHNQLNSSLDALRNKLDEPSALIQALSDTVQIR